MGGKQAICHTSGTVFKAHMLNDANRFLAPDGACQVRLSVRTGIKTSLYYSLSQIFVKSCSTNLKGLQKITVATVIPDIVSRMLVSFFCCLFVCFPHPKFKNINQSVDVSKNLLKLQGTKTSSNQITKPRSCQYFVSGISVSLCFEDANILCQSTGQCQCHLPFSSLPSISSVVRWQEITRYFSHQEDKRGLQGWPLCEEICIPSEGLTLEQT